MEKGLEKEKFSLPWFAIDNENPMPRNDISRLGYRRVNILLLWASAEKNKIKAEFGEHLINGKT